MQAVERPGEVSVERSMDGIRSHENEEANKVTRHARMPVTRASFRRGLRTPLFERAGVFPLCFPSRPATTRVMSMFACPHTSTSIARAAPSPSRCTHLRRPRQTTAFKDWRLQQWASIQSPPIWRSRSICDHLCAHPATETIARLRIVISLGPRARGRSPSLKLEPALIKRVPSQFTTGDH